MCNLKSTESTDSNADDVRKQDIKSRNHATRPGFQGALHPKQDENLNDKVKTVPSVWIWDRDSDQRYHQQAPDFRQQMSMTYPEHQVA